MVVSRSFLHQPRLQTVVDTKRFKMHLATCFWWVILLGGGGGLFKNPEIPDNELQFGPEGCKSLGDLLDSMISR